MSRRDLMQSKLLLLAIVTTVFTLSMMFNSNAYALDPSEDHYPLKLLGKFVFFDNISVPERQSCASCHAPETGGTNENARVNRTVVAVPGADFHVSGGLKPPTNYYASLIPEFHECNLGGFRIGGFPGTRYCAGNFWDGRAEGNDTAIGPNATKHIGPEVFQGAADDGNAANDFILSYATYFSGISDQALNPMPNQVEQNIERQAVCEHVANAAYAVLYEMAWGEPIDCSVNPVEIHGADLSGDELPEKEYDISFKRLALAMGAYQHSFELNSFSSKRDRALRAELACVNNPNGPDCDSNVRTHPNFFNSPGKFPLVGFTDQENLGHDLFYNTAVPFGPNPTPPPFPELPVTQCSFCHLSDASAPDGTGAFERYSDDAYHSIGTPANPAVPAEPQVGISGHLAAGNPGFFKTPTLRNVDKRPHSRFIKAYTHNGWFKSLESLVHFYNTSNVNGQTAADFGISRCPDTITSERRALRANCWPEPEWGAGAGFLVGNLGMNVEQEAALVAYLKTLSDLETVEPPELSELEALLNPQ
jgi:cytochrome c peroxidase